MKRVANHVLILSEARSEGSFTYGKERYCKKGGKGVESQASFNNRF